LVSFSIVIIETPQNSAPRYSGANHRMTHT
jgi:hypothetical protein